MAISRRRRPVAAGPLRHRPVPAPPANAGALSGLEAVGYLLAECVRAGVPPAAADTAWALDTLRSVYRVVRSMRPVAGAA